VENSSQDVSPLAALRARVGIAEVELADTTSEAIGDDAGDERSGDWKL
jgi:hypothetical protein